MKNIHKVIDQSGKLDSQSVGSNKTIPPNGNVTLLQMLTRQKAHKSQGSSGNLNN